jgi:cyanophycin synthetase
LIGALTRRGIEHRLIAAEERSGTKRKEFILSFSIDGVPFYFTGACLLRCDPHRTDRPGAIIDGPVAHFLKQKQSVKEFLREHGVSVPNGKAFSWNALQEAESYFAKFSCGLPNGVCVKPTNGNMGHLVHVGIRDISSFRTAFANVAQHYRKLIVEETVLGTVYRFTWLGGRVIFIEHMRPASVEGDGVHSITELVRQKNVERRVHPTHSSLLRLGPQQREFLDKAGLHPDDIPEAGRRVFLSSLSNLHQGADCIEARDAIHESYIDLVERTLKLFNGLVFCGVDIVIQEASQPARLGNHHILELNRCPGFSTCHYPWRGKSYDVAGAILDFLTESHRAGRRWPQLFLTLLNRTKHERQIPDDGRPSR